MFFQCSSIVISLYHISHCSNSNNSHIFFHITASQSISPSVQPTSCITSRIAMCVNLHSSHPNLVPRQKSFSKPWQAVKESRSSIGCLLCIGKEKVCSDVALACWSRAARTGARSLAGGFKFVHAVGSKWGRKCLDGQRSSRWLAVHEIFWSSSVYDIWSFDRGVYLGSVVEFEKQPWGGVSLQRCMQLQ
jgi:hypothetical protein